MPTAYCLLPSAFRFLVFASFQNLQTVKAEEVSVAGDGPPARVRVARAQGLAPGEAHEAGAVALVCVPLLARLVELLLGYRGGPGAEALAVAEGVQLLAVGDAVGVRVVPARTGGRAACFGGRGRGACFGGAHVSSGVGA